MLSVTIILSSLACLMFSVVGYIFAETLESVAWRDRALGAIGGSFAGVCVGIGAACIQTLMFLSVA